MIFRRLNRKLPSTTGTRARKLTWYHPVSFIIMIIKALCGDGPMMGSIPYPDNGGLPTCLVPVYSCQWSVISGQFFGFTVHCLLFTVHCSSFQRAAPEGFSVRCAAPACTCSGFAVSGEGTYSFPSMPLVRVLYMGWGGGARRDNLLGLPKSWVNLLSWGFSPN